MNKKILFLTFSIVAILVLTVGLVGKSEAAGNEWYVATNGTNKGDGSVSKPWDLQTALNHPSTVKPGDTIWVRGGTYYGSYVSNLKGSQNSPIIVRAYPGERATIDGQTDKKHLAIIESRGNDTWFWGLEIMSSYPKRGVFPCPNGGNCSWSDSSRIEGVATYGLRNKFINLNVHDTAQGYAFFQGVDQEIYGGLIYYNGWIATDRGHGHAIYTQNPHKAQPGPSKKLIAETIAFDGFGMGQRVYGSGDALGENVEFRGNVSFDEGAPAFGYNNMWMNYLVTMGSGAKNMIFEENHSYYSKTTNENGRVGIGYRWTPRDYNISVKNNYFIGGTNSVEIFKWNDINFSNNTVYSRVGNILYVCARADQSPSKWTFGSNNYYGTGKFRFTNSCSPSDGDTVGLTAYDFAGFKKATGLDNTSTMQSGKPAGVWTFVRPNKYEPGRANIIVYNWDLKPTVSVSLSDSGIKLGQKYEIKDAYNFYGPALLTGTYDGNPVTLSTALTAITPIVEENNNVVAELHHTAPEFLVYILLPINDKTSLPPVPQPDPVVDTQGPSVNIVYPVNNSTVSGNVNMSASASDTSGVKKVQFTLDGSNFGGEDTSSPYVLALDTTKLTNAIHTIGATATDNKGNVSSASVKVTVNNTNPPNNPPPVPNPNPLPSQKWETYIEAESGTLVSPMKISNNSDASAGSYITSTQSNSGSAQYFVNIPSNSSYYIWGRVLSPSFSNDSLTVSFGGSGEDTWDTAEKLWSTSWQWTRVTGRSSNGGLPVDLNATPRVFNLIAGTNSLIIKGRDVNTNLDRIYITNDPNSVPTGAVVTLPSAPEPDPTTPNIPPSIPPTPTNAAIRINAGGWSKEYTDAAGNVWGTDRYFDKGALAYGTNYGGPDFGLNATGRQGVYTDFAYRVPVSNGTYTVNLRFVELYQSASSTRVFNVNIEGKPALTNFDILKETSAKTLLVKTFSTTVTDGKLDIDFIGVKNRAIISGIEIIPTGSLTAAENKGNNWVNNIAGVFTSFIKSIGF